jgi:putative Holliday junction resolvase
MRYAKKYLGLDYGTKRIGLAIGDDYAKTAVVFGTVENLNEVKKIVAAEDIEIIVIGAPYSVIDSSRELPINFQKFLAELKAMLPDIKIILEDERLSSKYADSLIGGKKTKAGRDEIAAISILQGYLDRNSK